VLLLVGPPVDSGLREYPVPLRLPQNTRCGAGVIDCSNKNGQ